MALAEHRIPSDISAVITWLRLPLIVGVVMIHSTLNSQNLMPTFSVVKKIFSSTLPAQCVPLFYVFAGYLFFAKSIGFTSSLYWLQIRRRARSLGVPYLFWNAITIVFFWSMHRFAGNYINPAFENVAEFSPLQLLRCFWNESGGFPIAYQFWFIRDLMVVMLASPITYILVRKGIVGILLLTIIYFALSLPYFTAFFYFSVGAYLAVQQIDFVEISRKLLWISLFVSIALAITNVEGLLRKFYIIFSAISLIGLTDKYLIKKPLPRVISSSSFFVFSVHALALLILEKFAERILNGMSETMWIIAYFICPAVVIVSSIILYSLLKKLLPRFTAIITGGR